MEELRSSSRPATNSNSGGEEAPTVEVSSLRRHCISFGVSVQEKFRYFKATLFGIAKKLSARNEKEASEADLIASKMQVEAADEAENAKNKLIQNKSTH